MPTTETRRTMQLMVVTFCLVSMPLGLEAQSSARIVHPPSIAQPIPSSWATFGPMPVALYPVKGQLVQLDTDACDRDKLAGMLPELNPPIALTCEEALRPTCEGSQTLFGAAVLIRRGGCTFSVKALNLQELRTRDGYPVVAVIAANNEASEQLILIDDDGHGRFVQVPVLQTTWGAGKLLRVFDERHHPVMIDFGAPI